MHDFPPNEQSRALNPERRFLLQHIGFDKKITKALGNYYIDEAGNRYLDFLAQYGAVPFGHNPAALWETIYRHGSEHQPAFVQPLTSPGAEALAARLVEIAPGKMRYVTFVNSGAEAAEAAIKLARAHTGRQTILSTVRGFHGKTLGALSATDNPAYRAPFLLDTTCFERVAFDDLDLLETRVMRGDVAAFLVEPIQGEGGMRVPSRGYLLGAARICKQYGTLFVLDEIQTGLGRTGTVFAADAEPGLEPDILLLSKALGGGIVPLGAMLCTKSVWSEAFGFYHSSTFANSHFTCAIGCKVIDMLLADDQAVVRHAGAMGLRLERGLDDLVRTYPKAFAGRRGRCLMQALELAPWSGESSYFLSHASKKGFAVPLLSGYLLGEHGIVTAPVFNQNASLRLEPPLTIEAHEIDRLLAALDAAGRLIEAGDFTALFSFISGKPGHGVTLPPPVPALPNYQRPTAGEHKRGSFAFMIHPTDDEVLFNTLPPEFAGLDLTQKSSWRTWMTSWFSRMYEPAAVYHLPALRSLVGGYVEGWLIAAPLTPQRMMRLRKEEKKALLDAYVEAALELKVDIVGLGAFTSVIARGGEDLLGAPVNLTTGNSLTAIASAESLRAVALAQGRDFACATVAVIGAAGSIGRLTALHFARYARCVILFGNPKNPQGLDKLGEVAGEMYRTAAGRALDNDASGIAELLMEVIGPVELTLLTETIDATDLLGFKRAVEERLARVGVGLADLPIRLSDTLERDLGKADCVLSASAAGASFIDPAWFAPGCIVCDVARPLDVLGTVKGLRPDVFVYEGGVMKLPEHISFGAQNVLGYPRGYNLACLSETMVLAMDGARRNYSIGSRIDYAGALEIYTSSRLHGFEFAVLIDGVAQATAPLQMPSGGGAVDVAIEAV